MDFRDVDDLVAGESVVRYQLNLDRLVIFRLKINPVNLCSAFDFPFQPSFAAIAQIVQPS